MANVKYLISLYFLSIFLFLFDSWHFLAPVKDPLEQRIIPVLDGISKTKQSFLFFSKVLANYQNLSNMQFQIDFLQTEKSDINFKLNMLEQENTRLRDQLGSPLSSSYILIPAKVISCGRYLEIDAGQNQNVTVGMYAITGVNFIGKTIKTSKSRSLIMTYLDSEMRIPVKTSRGARGILAGVNNKTVLMTNILQKDALFLGDEVSTSGENDFPPDLLIGKINHIDSDDASAYKQGIVSPSVDVFTLPNIFLINDL